MWALITKRWQCRNLPVMKYTRGPRDGFWEDKAPLGHRHGP